MFTEQDSAKRQCALYSWAELIAPRLDYCHVGRSVLGHASPENLTSVLVESLGAILGRKAASTIYGRALAFAASRYQT